jgi:hypothetical protein
VSADTDALVRYLRQCEADFNGSSYFGEAADTIERLTRERDEAVARERERWLSAVAWALGTNGHFRPPNSLTPYWWRSELAHRCGISWDGEQWVDNAIATTKATT